MEQCRLSGSEQLMYSQFCYHIQQRRATIHIAHKPGEQVEVDWAGDPAYITDPDTGEMMDAYLFVGVMTYSQHAYVEAFINEKQQAWVTAHVHMYEYFGGAAKLLVPDNCKTAVVHAGGWYNQQIHTVYHEMAEHYGAAIIPTRVRKPSRKKSSTIFCSQYKAEGWYEQLGGNDGPLADAILDRSLHDAYKINIESINPSKDISMREVYGLDKRLSE